MSQFFLVDDPKWLVISALGMVFALLVYTQVILKPVLRKYGA
jgi:hypothetical protein